MTVIAAHVRMQRSLAPVVFLRQQRLIAAIESGDGLNLGGEMEGNKKEIGRRVFIIAQN